MKRSLRSRLVGIAFVASLACFAVLWTTVAEYRLLKAHGVLLEAKGRENAWFFVNASLDVGRSRGPLLKRPWRSDIRLYYIHEPRFSRNFCDAWAIQEDSGDWHFKIHH